MQRPESIASLRHVALNVRDLEACEAFYTRVLGMVVEWRPDSDNVYLSGGQDNLALHRAPAGFRPEPSQRLDHIGFMLDDMAVVDEWHAFMQSQGVRIVKPPRTHRDGARSFYCQDPDGNAVQMIYHPPLVKGR